MNAAHLLGSRNTVVRLALASLAFAAGLLQNAHAQPTGLELEARVAKTPVVIGEPVYLIIRLRNTGSAAASVYPELEVDTGVLGVSIDGPDSESRAFLPFSLREADARMIDLPVGADVVAVNPIFFGAQGWTFTEPGRYRVFAGYRRAPVGALTSPPVDLEVVAGDGAGAALLASGQAADEAGKFLLWFSGDHLTQGIARLDRLSMDSPESPVASYYHLAMAVSLGEPFRNLAAGTMRAAQPAAAIARLNRVAPTALPPHLRVASLLAGAKAARGLGNEAEMARRLELARSMLEADPVLRQLFQLALDQNFP